MIRKNYWKPPTGLRESLKMKQSYPWILQCHNPGKNFRYSDMLLYLIPKADTNKLTIRLMIWYHILWYVVNKCNVYGREINDI